jgi:Pvc16 N-terminal domain
LGNFLAFASVTATISYILEEVNRDIPGIRISTRPLDAIDIQNPVNGLNIFLYLVSPTTSVDAVDTLVIDKAGRPTNNPSLSLDLYYIITATSSENEDLVAQKILASAMRVLNNHPVLERDLIRKAVRNKEGLEFSDLADQIDDVRLALNPLSLKDLSEIWSKFPNANFRSSIAYTAQVVILDSKIVEEPPGIIASIDQNYIVQLKSPSIERIDPRLLEYAPDARMAIIGSNLKGPAVYIEFGGNFSPMQVKPADISDTRVVVGLPADIEPGMLNVRITHRLRPVNKEEEEEQMEKQIIGKRSILQSNSSPFVLAPRILTPRQGKVARGNALEVEFEPPVSRGKAVIVYLGDSAFPASPAKSSKSMVDSKVGRVKFTVPKDTQPGLYLLRMAVDGAASLLMTDENPRSPSFRKSIGPYVKVVS